MNGSEVTFFLASCICPPFFRTSLCLCMKFDSHSVLDDKTGLGMLPINVSFIEDNNIKHFWIKEEAEESKYEPSVKEEPVICDEPKSVKDAEICSWKDSHYPRITFAPSRTQFRDKGQQNTSSISSDHYTSPISYNLFFRDSLLAFAEVDALSSGYSSASVGKPTVCPPVLEEDGGSLVTVRENNLIFSERSESDPLFVCRHCDYRTDKKMLFTRHILLQESVRDEPFACNKCCYKTNRKSDLKTHLLTHESVRVKPFACNQCSYSANTKSNLKKHLPIHENVRKKTFACNHCSYRASQKSTLKMHLLIHESVREKPFACNHCSYRANQKIHLERHFLIHESVRDKPFACNHCSYRAYQKNHLKTHLLLHEKVGNKPFACNHCSYSSNKKCNLKTHLLIHECQR